MTKKISEYSQVFLNSFGFNRGDTYENALFKKCERNFEECTFDKCTFSEHSGRFDKCTFVNCKIRKNDSIFIDCEFLDTDTKGLNEISRDEVYRVYDTTILVRPVNNSWVVVEFGDNSMIYTTDDSGKRKSAIFASEGGITRSAPVSKEDIEFYFQ